MVKGTGLIGWVIGSVIVGFLWFGVRDIITDSVGENGWWLATVFVLIIDLIALMIVIIESQ